MISRRMMFLLPIIPWLFFSISNMRDVHTFKKNSPFSKTQGQIASRDCGNHTRYRATYKVNGHVITQCAGNLYLGSDSYDLSVGDQVALWYSNSDPAYISFLPPKRALTYMYGELILTLILVYPFFVGVLWWINKKKERDYT